MSKKVFIISIFFLGFALFTTSCKKDKDAETKTCNIEKSSVLELDMDLVFKVDITGDANCTRISYTIAGIEQSISNPSLPWILNTTALEGDTVDLRAYATTENGSITLSISGEAPTSSLHLSESCSQYND